MQVFRLSQCAIFWYLWTEKFTFGEQLLEGVPGQRATDLQPLWHNSGRDELVVGNFFVQLVVGSLVEEHQVVELIPHFSLGPLLLSIKEIYCWWLGKLNSGPLQSLLSNDGDMWRDKYGCLCGTTYLLLGFASRFVDWVLVLFGLPSVLLLVLLGRLTT